MNQIVDLAQYDREIEDRRKHRERSRDALRESLRQYLKHLQNDGESALDYARDLKQANGDVSEELNEMEAHAKSMLLVIGILRGQICKSTPSCANTTPAS